MPEERSEKNKAIDLALMQIEKQFGKGSIMRLGTKDALVPVEIIPTGAISFDAALGMGGMPRGRVVEIFGPESSGKTTIALHVVAEAQKRGGMAAYIDAEHAMDAAYAKKLGVDIDNLLVSQPDYGEQALEIAESLVRSNAIDVLVIDSVAALVPKAELDGDMGDSLPGLQARLMSQALRKLAGIVAKSKTCLIFINQIREKIGVMFGNPETTTGGRALKFYSSVRVDIRRIASIKDGDRVVGNRTKVKIVKNKMAAPFREAEFDILYGEGISKEGDLIDIAAERNILEKSGAWFSYGGERIGQGRENARQFLRDNRRYLQEAGRPGAKGPEPPRASRTSRRGSVRGGGSSGSGQEISGRERVDGDLNPSQCRLGGNHGLHLFTDASGNETKANIIQSTEERREKLVKATCHPGVGNCLVVGDRILLPALRREAVRAAPTSLPPLLTKSSSAAKSTTRKTTATRRSTRRSRQGAVTPGTLVPTAIPAPTTIPPAMILSSGKRLSTPWET